MSTYRVGDYVRALIDQETGEIVGFRTPADEDQILALSSVSEAAVLGALGYTPEDASKKGAGNGYASLDGTGRVPASQLPILGTYLGPWDANTNTPTLTAVQAVVAGSYRIVTAAGTKNIGEGSILYGVGDLVVYNGNTAWNRVALATAGVASATALDAIADFDATDVQAGIEELVSEKAEKAAPIFLDEPGGATVMRITAAGNVGVGASIPSGLYGKFGVLGTGTQSLYVQSTDGGGAIVQLQADGATGGEIGTVSDHPFQIKTNDINRITVNGAKLQADWSNATFASRMSLQTSTLNSNTNVQVIPNGTGTTAGYVVLNNSTPADCAFAQFSITSTKARLLSSAIGSGTQLPLEVVVGGSSRIDVAVNGEVSIPALLSPVLPAAPTYLQTISQIMQGERVSVWRFLFNGQDAGAQTKIDLLRSGTDTTDYHAGFQDMLDAAELNAFEGYVPPVWQFYRIASPLVMQYPMKITGAGTHPYRSEVGTRDRGSWLYFDHSGIGLDVNGNGEEQLKSGVVLEGLGTIRNQLDPTTPGWAPVANDFDFNLRQVDIRMEDILMLNPTKGINHSPGNAGRMRLFDVRGQPFDIGIKSDNCFDSHRFENIHWWPYWSNLAAINTYTKANRKGIYFWHVDNPYVDNYFDIFSAYSLFFTDGVDGQPTSRALISNFGFDQVGLQAVYIEAGADNTTVQLNNGYALGEGAFNALAVYANNCTVSMNNFRATNFRHQAVIASGTGNRVQATTMNVELCNLDDGGYQAFAATGTSKIEVADDVLHTPTYSEALANDGLLVRSPEWKAYTPTFTATTGTLGDTAYTGAYRHNKGLIHFTVTLTITTNSNGFDPAGSGALQFTLPTAAKFGTRFNVMGKEVNATGRAVAGVAAGSTTVVFTYADNNTYPGANGTEFILSGFYEPAI